MLTPQIKGSGILVKNLISAAVTGLFLSAAGGLAPAAAQQPKSLPSDSVFITRAGSAGLLQVKLGNLAEKKGTSPAVLEFGKGMVTHYSKANEELKAAAKEAGYPAPPLLRRDQLCFDRFNGMGRSSFDKAYMAEMVERQNEEVRLFQGVSRRAGAVAEAVGREDAARQGAASEPCPADGRVGWGKRQLIDLGSK